MTQAKTEIEPLNPAVAQPARPARLPMCLSERRLLLLLLDLLALNGALLLALALRPAYPLTLALIGQNPLWFLLLSALWPPLAWALDAYDVHLVSQFPRSALAVLKAGLLSAGIYLLIPYLTPPLPTARWMLFAWPLLALVLLVAGRGLYALTLAQPMFCRRALIVGGGWAGRTIAQTLAERANGTYEIVGFVDDDPDKQRTTVHGKLNVLGDRHTLPELIAGHKVTTLVLAITHEIDGELFQALIDCLEQGVEIIPMPVLYEQLTGRVPVEHVGGNWYVAMPLDHPGTSATWPLVKRLFDLVSAGLGALCLGLATPFIALAIYLESPGPIFYTQERVGKGGKRFRVYKFRSMVPDAEKRGQAVWAKEKDPRITRVGRVLRKTHVDEFPQFFNILKGEMSAVGPRPERPEFVAELVDEIPFYQVRHAVKPGMAGWGLVKQGYGSSKEDALIKLQYDLYYIKHQSLWLDVVILLKTVLDTLTLGGR